MKNNRTGLSKGIILPLFIFSFFLHPAPLLCADDCAKNADSCAAGTRTLSPFVEASRAENTAAPAAPAPVKKAQAVLKQAPVLAVSTSAAPVPEGGPAPDGKLSSPAWLILVAGGFAGLYFYLRGGIKRRRRK